MSQSITITREDIFQQVKLSCQIPSIIEGIMTRRIITLAAQEAGIKVEAEELQTAADNIRLINQLHNADDTWAWLEKHSLSLDDFEDIVYTTIISEKLAQYLFADTIEPYFYENQLDYAGVVMYEVVLDNEDLAIELFYGMQEGETSFHEIARQYIQDTELRRIGGYRGIVSRREIKPEISAAVFAANPPQILKPIVTSRGVHLILVEEIIQPQLDDTLRSQILANLFENWVKQQVEEAEIVMHLEQSQ
ncbi:MAG: peptidylprolyl isomerase [Calothrix sp. MO_167.B42]|nr:peptidylprolyl isomerase [Calothrix sp. MO_167.B42]